MGSYAYGASSDLSDRDIYGFCIPEKSMIFPHLQGEIPGFGIQINRFEQYQQHGIVYQDSEYDLTIYSIVKYFQLVMEGNPNMVDSLFTPQHAIMHCSTVGHMVRERRKIFLHKGYWHKFKGYAYSQLHKIRTKERHDLDLVEKVVAIEKQLNIPKSTKFEDAAKYGPEYLDAYQKMLQSSPRLESIKCFDYDVKFGYHLVRLMLEIEQILTTQDLILNRDAELLKAIRRGEWTYDRIVQFFELKEKGLEEAYQKSDLPHSPRQAEIRRLLLDCLESHFGNLKDAVEQNSEGQILTDIVTVLKKWNVI